MRCQCRSRYGYRIKAPEMNAIEIIFVRCKYLKSINIKYSVEDKMLYVCCAVYERISDALLFVRLFFFKSINLTNIILKI